MAHVCLQAGHLNISENCWPSLRGSTGAPEEVGWNAGTQERVGELLRSHGVEVTLVDACANCDSSLAHDFDMLLAIHYQSDPPHVSGFGVFAPAPDADMVYPRSCALRDQLARTYGARVGIPDRSASWKNANTDYYYLWQSATGPTPCVLIECGVGASGAPDHELLFGQQDRIAAAIAEGVCDGLGVAWEYTPPPPPPPAPASLIPPTGDFDWDRWSDAQERTVILPRPCFAYVYTSGGTWWDGQNPVQRAIPREWASYRLAHMHGGVWYVFDACRPDSYNWWVEDSVIDTTQCGGTNPEAVARAMGGIIR